MPAKVQADKTSTTSTQAVERHSLLRVNDVVARLGISPRTVWSLTKGGQLRHIRIGKSVRYQAADVEAFIVANAS